MSALVAVLMGSTSDEERMAGCGETQIVEVIKEVPVEKIVTKIVTAAADVRPQLRTANLRFQLWYPTPVPALKNIADLLNQKYPQLKVDVEAPGDYWTKLQTAIAGGAARFVGLVVLQATLAFWTTETLEIVNTVTYGGVQTTQYPIAVYRPWFRKFFAYVVPLACVSYFPAIAIIGRTDPLGSPIWFQYLSPLIGVGFLLVALQVWKFGVRHYVSTGS